MPCSCDSTGPPRSMVSPRPASHGQRFRTTRSLPERTSRQSPRCGYRGLVLLTPSSSAWPWSRKEPLSKGISKEIPSRPAPIRSGSLHLTASTPNSLMHSPSSAARHRRLPPLHRRLPSRARRATMTVKGTRFRGLFGIPWVQNVRLNRTGQPDIVATNITTTSKTHLTCSVVIPAGTLTKKVYPGERFRYKIVLFISTSIHHR